MGRRRDNESPWINNCRISSKPSATLPSSSSPPVSLLDASPPPFTHYSLSPASNSYDLHVIEQLSFQIEKMFQLHILAWGVVEDASLPHLAPSTASGSRPTVLQKLETAMGNPHIPLAPEATTDVPSPSIPARPVPPPGNVRQSVKRKAGAKSREEVSRTSTSPPLGKCEYINIGSRQDKLDPTVLGKLPPAVAIAATSVHKYWTSAFGKAADTAEATELVKLAEIYTSRSHVLNCEMYKMLEIKVDELHSAIEEDEDVEDMRAENKHLRARLAFSEDARTRATYDVTKAQTIQKTGVDARKKAESQLKSCQSMIHAKDKELTEALSGLAKAKDLLAKLGAPGYAEP
ncbi:Uncharacterized protein Fot_09238 [Forsythia ovata]|uniref:Uncharacterized protein n=1 Tax=Forsythia ovata TaxID=205694 RepID=A0ABD1WDF9_9LAMI